MYIGENPNSNNRGAHRTSSDSLVVSSSQTNTFDIPFSYNIDDESNFLNVFVEGSQETDYQFLTAGNVVITHGDAARIRFPIQLPSGTEINFQLQLDEPLQVNKFLNVSGDPTNESEEDVLSGKAVGEAIDIKSREDRVWSREHGVFRYENTYPYSINDIVLADDDNLYISLQNQNINNAVSNSTFWREYFNNEGETYISDASPSYVLDADVGIIGESVVRNSTQTYLQPNGILGVMQPNILLPSYENGRYAFDVYESRTNFIPNSERLDLINVLQNSFSKLVLDGTERGYNRFRVDAGSTSTNTIRFNGIGVVVDTYTISMIIENPTVQARTIRIDIEDRDIADILTVPPNSKQEYSVRLDNTLVDTSFVDISSILNSSLLGLFISNVQFEIGSSKSPYIPTTGSSITRNATTISDSSNGRINPSEGSMVLEFDGVSHTNDHSRLFVILAALNSSRFGISYNRDTDQYSVEAVKSNTGIGSIRLPYSSNSNIKIACSYDASTVRGSINGSSVVRVNIINTFDEFSNINIGHIVGSSTSVANTRIYNASYYPVSFSDRELIAHSS